MAQTGIQVAGTLLSASAADQKAKATWSAAQSDLANKYSAIQARETQEIMRTNQEVINAQKQGSSAVSRVRVAASAGGVSGASVQEREQGVTNAVSDYASTAKLNLTNELAQNQLDAESARAHAQSVINDNPTENPWEVGLGVAGDVLQGAAKGESQATSAGQSGVVGALMGAI